MWAAIRRIDQKLFEPFDQYPRLLSEAIGDSATLLDVGCGSSSPIQYLPQRFDRVVGVDGFQPSLDRARTLGCHHELIRMELLDIGSRFPRSRSTVSSRSTSSSTSRSRMACACWT